MTRKTIIAATVGATSALGSVAFADQGHGRKTAGEAGYSHHGLMHRGDQATMGNSAQLMQTMMQMHGQMTGGSMMDGGMMGRMGAKADGDGAITTAGMTASAEYQYLLNMHLRYWQDRQAK